MKIGLIDVDGKKFPNLALMKISAYHKAKGDLVEWCFPLDSYDRVYISKVFDEIYTPDIDYIVQAKEIIKGGTGYVRRRKKDNETWLEFFVNGRWVHEKTYKGTDVYNEFLPHEIEHIYPDYSLYPDLTKDTSFGYLTRGCPRNCAFCCVGAKEGLKSVKVANLSEFWRDQKYIKLFDPNILACRDHLNLLTQLSESNAYIDITQGLDIRMTTTQNIELINSLKLKQIHFAWDNPKDALEKRFEKYAALAKRKPHGYYASVYVLTNFGSTMKENLYRIYTLRNMGFDPYVMIYNKPSAPREILRLQRWVNNKKLFKSVDRFEDYDVKIG